LAFQLWPDSPERQARTKLRWMVQWRADAPWTLDVAEFEQDWISQRAQQTSDRPALILALRQAVDRYHGELLPGCYDDWLQAERERPHQAFLAALEKLILLLEQAHDYATAIVCGQRLIQLDPLHEAIYQHLMRLHARRGDRPNALRVY
jgi:DNA-binding SARP family transcriptional activator